MERKPRRRRNSFLTARADLALGRLQAILHVRHVSDEEWERAIDVLAEFARHASSPAIRVERTESDRLRAELEASEKRCRAMAEELAEYRRRGT